MSAPVKVSPLVVRPLASVAEAISSHTSQLGGEKVAEMRMSERLKEIAAAGEEVSENERLDMMIETADQSGVSLDLLLALSRGMPASALVIFSGNAASLPRYMKSMSRPSLSHNFSA